jgi:hypothetical protein
VVRAVMAVLPVTVPRLPAAAHVVRPVAMPRLPMAATNPQRQQVLPMPRKPPLSASAKSPRQLQQLTAPKENKDAATCSQKIPQRAKGP